MTLHVHQAGAQTLVQDAGRTGYAHLGVPISGAFDKRAWRLANRLVGNPEQTPALECLGGGLTLTATTHTTVAITGAQGDVLINGRPHATHHVLHLAPGADLVLRPPHTGIRYYLAVAGGLVVPHTLGSAASDTLGHLGPVVRPGDELAVGPVRTSPVTDHAPPHTPATIFDIMAGPDLDPAGLLERSWDLDPQSNRIGVRLSGRPLPAPRHGLPSKPMVAGAVQLPPNGLPIILGPDHPTTGGYPVIAVVTGRSLDDVAQWSGGPRRFRLLA